MLTGTEFIGLVSIVLPSVEMDVKHGMNNTTLGRGLIVDFGSI